MDKNQKPEKILQDFFYSEKRVAKGINLQNKIEKSIHQKQFKRTKEAIISIAAILILAIVLTATFSNKKVEETNIKQSQVIYQDEDFVLYVQE